MRMILNTIYVTDADNLRSAWLFDNSMILCYAIYIIVIHSLWIKMIAADKAVDNLNQYLEHPKNDSRF